MLLFRSFVVGLLGACCLLIASRPTEIRVITRPVVARDAPAPTGATLVDVSPLVATRDIPGMLHLAAGEHVIAVDGANVAGDVETGILFADPAGHRHGYIDVTVAGPAGQRRIVVLLH